MLHKLSKSKKHGQGGEQVLKKFPTFFVTRLFVIAFKSPTDFLCTFSDLTFNALNLAHKFSSINIIHSSTYTHLLPSAVKTCYNYVPLLMWTRSTLTRHDNAGSTSALDVLRLWSVANCLLACQTDLILFILHEAPLLRKELKCQSLLCQKYENNMMKERREISVTFCTVIVASVSTL
jgi:hypothetical protein